MLVLVIAGVLAIAIPSITAWASQGPYLTMTLERKLQGLRKSLAFVQEMSNRVEQVTSAPAPVTATGAAAPASEKVVVRSSSLLGELASTTPVVILQLLYAGVLAFLLLAHRNFHRRQILRIPVSFGTRVRLARVVRDINNRVGRYLLSLTLIYSGVAVIAACALWALGFSNPIAWGAALGVASFIPFVGPPVVIGLVAIVALLSFDEWTRIVAAPVALLVIHVIESQLVTPAIVGRRLALNTASVFVSIALLGWMWGAIGALVAVPLLILLSTIAAHLPVLRWLQVLLADDQPLAEPPMRARIMAATRLRSRAPMK
jgi:predicted PurR-regulated permease PerM